MVRLDSRGRVLWVSDELFDNQPEQLTGLAFPQLFPAACQHQVRRAFKPETARTTQRLSLRDPATQRSASVLVRPSETQGEVAFFAVVIEPPQQRRRTKSSQRRAAASTATFATSNKVLVAEDEPALRKLIGRILNMGGYRVTFAADGNEFRAQLDAKQGEFALVFLDLEMPGPPTVDLLDDLDQLEPRPPLVVVTGHPASKVAERMEGRAYTYLSKPFSNAELLELAANLAPIEDV